MVPEYLNLKIYLSGNEGRHWAELRGLSVSRLAPGLRHFLFAPFAYITNENSSLQADGCRGGGFALSIFYFVE